MISGFPLHEENIVLESATPRRGENGGPGRTRTFDLPINITLTPIIANY